MGPNKRANFFVIAVITGAAALCSCKSADHTPIIATINGDKIHRSEFDRFLRIKLGDLTTAEVPDALKSQMLDDFIARKLVLVEAARAGLSVSESEVEQTAQDPQMKSPAATEDA